MTEPLGGSTASWCVAWNHQASLPMMCEDGAYPIILGAYPLTLTSASHGKTVGGIALQGDTAH